MATFKRCLFVSCVAAVTALAGVAAAGGPPIAGCPHGEKWTLVTVESLNIPPELLAGLASLDNNGDGYTCIMPAGLSLTFRDNTVREK